ncbi:Mitogen-activated protein kinase kinase kinase [Parasponia andersonii]|uniref:non-specific serine/threonine protein kinase n=1 Tax=Parasponia andersonii TaxID=3476 RepID=A0A2P5ACP7_PARAD|nr:Mitogen-activated protein kinase kinase kinase [Parasponia andersonii]
MGRPANPLTKFDKASSSPDTTGILQFVWYWSMFSQLISKPCWGTFKEQKGTSIPSTSDSKQNETASMAMEINNNNNSNNNNNNNNNNVNDDVNPPKERSKKPSLKVFSLAELKTVTREFGTFLGEGVFGEVFKGWLNDKTYAPSTSHGVGIPVAVKKSKFPHSCQGLKEWKAEVKFLANLSHPNLVELLGFCWEENQFLLVYEYMTNGSLEKYIFTRAFEALEWRIRLKIAIGAARGLAFLHSLEKPVIYRDFKTSNILLDEAYNAKLSDFGLAKFGPVDGKSHVTTRVMGTHGYAAPEYVATVLLKGHLRVKSTTDDCILTGYLYVKSDVYGFGVVMLEMLTGRRAIDEFRPEEEIELVKWAGPYLKERKRLKKIMDPRLADQYPMEGAWQAAELITKCLQYDRKNRPSMEEVLESLENINAIPLKHPK